MENDPKVSIITAVYNGEATISRTIESVLKQSYPNIQYIIVDGSSTDQTLAIIAKLNKGNFTVISSPDESMYEAMNKGIEIATGELIGIINSDDWYEKDAVSNVVAAYSTHPQVEIFHGLLRYHNTDQHIEAIMGHEASFLNKGMIEHPTCFVKKELYSKIGLFNLNYRFAADYEFMLRAYNQKARFSFIPQLLANFSIGGSSTSFEAAKETLTIQYHYRLISMVKKQVLIFYWWLKCRK